MSLFQRIEIKNPGTTDRAKVAATASVAEGDIVVGVQAPVLGVTSGAALDADGSGTLQQYLRGLLKAFLARTSPKASTPAVTSVVAAVADTAVLAANANRLGGCVFNDSTANCYLKLGTGASATSFTVKMSPADYFEIPFWYTGAVNGYWDAVNGSARVTELTA